MAGCECLDGVLIEVRNGRTYARECPRCRALTRARLERLEMASGLPEVATVPLIAPQLVDECASRWAIFTGATGSGKTTQAVNLARAILRKGVRTRFYNACDITRRVMFRRDALDEFADCELVVLDDLFKGAPRPSSSRFDSFYAATVELLWRRYDARLPLIVTTERGWHDFVSFDAAFAGRVLERSTRVDCGARNRRLDDQGGVRAAAHDAVHA